MNYSLVGVLFFMLFSLVNGQQINRFQNYTYVDNICCLAEIDENSLVLGSEGGIINYNSSLEDYSIINATQKLLDLNITSIEKINESLVVAGTYFGKLYLIDINNNDVIEEYNDLDDRIITDIHHNNDTLWVATQKIVSVFKVLESELQYVDIFENFPVTVEEINTITVFENELFVGTNNSLMN